MTDMEWRIRAACRTTPVDMYPEGSWESSRSVQAAKTVCRGCSVRGECLEYALSAETYRDSRWGIWGGMTPSERHQVAAERAS